MAQKPDNNKKDKKNDNKIREGSDDSIHREVKESNRQSYPKPDEKDTQYKDQPEFIDNEPNRKDEEE